MALSDYLTAEDAKKIKVVQKIDTSKLKAANPSSELNRIDREKESIASPSSPSLPKTTTKETQTYKSNIVSSGVQNSLLSMPEMNNTLEFKGHNYVADQPIRNALKRIDNAGTSILNSMPAQFGVIEDALKQTVKGNNNIKAIEKQMTMQKNAVDRMNYLSNYKHRGNKEALLNDPEYQEALKLYNSASRVINAYNNKPMEMNSDVMQAYGDALALRNKATEGLSPTGQFLGNTAISIGETLSTLPLAVANPSLPLAMAAARGTANKIYDVGNQGKSASEALSRGAASGAVEAATEKIGLDKALDIIKSPATKGLKSVATNMLKQGATEGLEEGASYIGNYAVDKTFDKNTQFDAKELGTSMLGGLLSGGAIGGISSGVSGLKNDDITRLRIREELKKYMYGETKPSGVIEMGITPNILLEYGAKPLTITLPYKNIKKIVYPEGYMGGKHNLGFFVIEDIPKQLSNPTAILKSDTEKDSFVIFTEYTDYNNNPVMIALHLNKNGELGLSNEVASVYGRKEFDEFIEKSRKKGNILYENKKGPLSLPVRKGNPLRMAVDSDPIFSINKNNKNSNSKSSNLPGTLPNNSTNTETSSFKKNTVGAAENNPNSTRQKLDELAEKYGALPQGENATRIANLPKQIDDSNKRVNKYAGTMIEAENIPDDLVGRIEEGVAEGRYSHDLITDADAMQRAEKIISKDDGETALKKWDKAVKENSFTKYDLTLGQELLIEFANIGDVDTAARISEELDRALSIAGQNLQTGRMLKKLTPKGMVTWGELELAKTRRMLAEKGVPKEVIDKIKLSEADINAIKGFMEEAGKMPDGRNKDVKIAQAKAIIDNKIPAAEGDKVRALARIATLSNPKTVERNIIGNIAIVPAALSSDVVGTLIDKGVAKKTGVRTTSLPQISALQGIPRGLKYATEDYKLGINTAPTEGNRYEITNNKVFDDNKKIGKYLNKTDKTTSYALSLGDRPFYEAWYDNSIKQQLKANKVNEPTDAMEEIAKRDALTRTWQNNNKYTESTIGLRGVLNKYFSIKGYGLGDMVIMYAKTPVNLTKALFDYSPAGVINAIKNKSGALTRAIETGEGVELAQRDFVDTLSKGIVGTILMSIFAAAKEKGLITGKADEDRDVAQFEKEVMGIMPYSIKIGNKSYTYDWLLPLGGTAAMSVDAYDAYKDAKSSEQDAAALNAFIAAVVAAGKTVFNQSFTKGIARLLEGNDPITGAMDVMLDEPSKFTPVILSQIAQVIDGNARTTYVYDNKVETAINKVKAKIPGLRETLPLTTNTLGEPKQFNESPLDVFLNPANYSTDISTESTQWMYDLYKATGNKAILPPEAPNYIEYNNEKYVLTPQDKEGYQQITGKIALEGVETLLISPYADVWGEDAEGIMKALYSYAKEKAKIAYIPGYEPDAKTTAKIDDLKLMGLTTGEAVALKYLIGESKDSAKANDYIMSLDYDEDTKEALSNYFSNNVIVIPGTTPDFSSPEAYAESTSTARSRGWEALQSNKSFSNMTEDQYDEAYNIISISEKGKTKEDKIKELANYFRINLGYTGTYATTQANKFWKAVK